MFLNTLISNNIYRTFVIFCNLFISFASSNYTFFIFFNYWKIIIIIFY
nr:MAG TPA: hypothetical protein [Caudoviricetes sp.]